MKAIKTMIYGAYGYTGELIARQAVSNGHKPVLAGRNASKLQQLSRALGLSAIVVDLQDNALEQALSGVDLVIHCAGPFSLTAEPMLRACIASGTHYQDISGEISVYQLAHSFDEEAKTAGVVLCPGTGFDIIPTDCLAMALYQHLPSATHLTLGFDSDTRLSPGTAKTSIERLGIGGAIRRNGKIETVNHGELTREIDFGRGNKFSVAIPWGDVASAYHSTGIQNIEVYLPISPKRAKQMQLINKCRWLLRNKKVQKWLKYKIEKTIQGPDETQRAEHKTWVWGEVRNDRRGERHIGRIQTANGYNVTVNGALAVMDFILNYHGPGGYFTPSRLCGHKLIEQLPGSGKIELSRS